jgi:hypothetical protein
VAVLDLLALVGVYMFGVRHAAKDVTTLQSNSDPSPIIITDGGSIHFAQKDQWLYESDTNIAAQLANHTVTSLMVGPCTAAGNGSAVGNCPSDLTIPDITGGKWSLFLCATNTCDTKNWAAEIDSDNSEVVINSKSQNPFIVEPKGTDGASFKLNGNGTSLKWVALKMGNNPVQAPMNCGSDLANKKPCVVRICYANNNQAACK